MATEAGTSAAQHTHPLCVVNKEALVVPLKRGVELLLAPVEGGSCARHDLWIDCPLGVVPGID